MHFRGVCFGQVLASSFKAPEPNPITFQYSHDILSEKKGEKSRWNEPQLRARVIRERVEIDGGACVVALVVAAHRVMSHAYVRARARTHASLRKQQPNSKPAPVIVKCHCCCHSSQRLRLISVNFTLAYQSTLGQPLWSQQRKATPTGFQLWALGRTWSAVSLWTPVTNKPIKSSYDGIILFLGCQWVGMPGQGSRLSIYWLTKWANKWWCSQHASAFKTPIPCALVASPGFKQTKKGGVWRADAPAFSNRASLAWAGKPINAAMPGLETSVY